MHYIDSRHNKAQIRQNDKYTLHCGAMFSTKHAMRNRNAIKTSAEPKQSWTLQ